MCSGKNISPITLGHGTSCPVPCATTVLFDISDVAACSVCMTQALEGESLNAAYGFRPPAVPGTISTSALTCQKVLAKAASGLRLAGLVRLPAARTPTPAGEPAGPDCATDPNGGIARQASRRAGGEL